MSNVEILENATFNIAESVKFKVVKEQVATMIINGVAQQTQDVECVVMTCPKCSNVLNKFDAHISLIDVYKAFSNFNDINDAIVYCSKCGQKISLDKRVFNEQVGEN